MKRRKNNLIAVVVIIALIAVLLSSSNFNANFYYSKLSDNISSNWNNKKSVGRINNATDEISFSENPVVVKCKSRKVGDVNAPNPVVFDISDANFGPLWIPLFKVYSYSYTCNCNHTYEVKKGLVRGTFSFDGTIRISGDYRIIGVCSRKVAGDLVIEKAMNNIYKAIKEEFSKVK